MEFVGVNLLSYNRAYSLAPVRVTSNVDVRVRGSRTDFIVR